MKTSAIGLFIFAFGGICLADYSPQYESYVTQAVDYDNNISQTVLVDGTTTGDCYLNGGTYYISNCPSTHTPNITNAINGVDGSGQGGNQSMFDYISFQTTVTIAGIDGQNYQTTTQAQVYCQTGNSNIYDTGYLTGQVSTGKSVYLVSSDCFQTNPNGTIRFTGGWGDLNNLLQCALSDRGPDLPPGGKCGPVNSTDTSKNNYKVTTGDATSGYKCKTYSAGNRRHVEPTHCLYFLDQFPLLGTSVSGQCP